MDPDAIVIKEPVGIVVGIPTDGGHSPSSDILLGLYEFAKSLWIHELPFTEVVKGGDLIFEGKLCPLDRLLQSTKAAGSVDIAKVELDTEMVLPIVKVDGTIERQRVEQPLDEVRNYVGFAVFKVGLERLRLEAAHAESFVKDKEKLADSCELPHLAKALRDRVKLDHWRRRWRSRWARHSAEGAARGHGGRGFVRSKEEKQGRDTQVLGLIGSTSFRARCLMNRHERAKLQT